MTEKTTSRALQLIAPRIEKEIENLQGRIDTYTGNKGSLEYVCFKQDLAAAEKMYAEAQDEARFRGK